MTTTNPNQTYSPTYLAEDKSQNLINVVVAFAILDTLFICLFFTSRVIGHTANGLDMYLMIPAYLFAFANIILGARKFLAPFSGIQEHGKRRTAA